MSSSLAESDNEDLKSVKNGQSTSVHIGPEINCDSVDIINNESTFVCFSCSKMNPVILTISNTFSFIFGSFLDNICCCISSISQRVLLTAVLTVVVVGTTTGGLVGRHCM